MRWCVVVKINSTSAKFDFGQFRLRPIRLRTKAEVEIGRSRVSLCLCRVPDYLFLNVWNHVLECVHGIYLLSFWFAEVFRFFGFQGHWPQRDAHWLRLRHACLSPVRFCFGWACAPGCWTEGCCSTLSQSGCFPQTKLISLCLSPRLLPTFPLPSGSLAASLTVLPTAWLRLPCSSKVFSSFMRLISDRIVSCASCDWRNSIFFWTLWTGILIFASLGGTDLAASVLRCLFSVGQLESTILTLTRIWDFSIVSSHLHLDCGICLCVVTRSSPTLLTNCLGSAVVFCTSRAVGTCWCVFVWCQLHNCDGLFQNRQWHTHIDDLFVDSLWRASSADNVFAGVFSSRCPSWTSASVHRCFGTG